MRGIFAVEMNRLGILELDEPVLGDYDALVEVKACGICNSTDLKIIEGRFKKGSFPILLGHESSGTVTKVGRKVKHFQVGDTVLRSRLFDKDISVPGGSSRFGGFVEKAVVTDAWEREGMEYNAFPHPQQVVPDYIDPVYATAIIVLKENLHCIKNTDVKPGMSLAIVGTGPAAQSMVMWAKLLQISPVVVFGRRNRWGHTFEKLGADSYVVGNEYPAEVKKITKAGGFDRSIEAVGSNDALKKCLEITRRDGRVNLYGMPADDERYCADKESDPRIFRAKVLEAEVHEELIGFIENGMVRLEDWVSHIYAFEDYQTGFDLVKSEKPTKVIIEMHA